MIKYVCLKPCSSEAHRIPVQCFPNDINCHSRPKHLRVLGSLLAPPPSSLLQVGNWLVYSVLLFALCYFDHFLLIVAYPEEEKGIFIGNR